MPIADWYTEHTILTTCNNIDRNGIVYRIILILILELYIIIVKT